VLAQREAETAILSLVDDGPGIPEALQDEVLKRGSRLDRSGPGTGLGLSIVKEIAAAWGAELSFQSGESGFSVQLRLPLARA